MEVYPNEAGGLTVEVRPGDRLEDVPESHVALLSAGMREWFADVPGQFRQIADAAPVPAMREWVLQLVEEGDWRLTLHRSGSLDYSRAGIEWRSEAVRGAEVGPPVAGANGPGAVGTLFRLIGYLDWMGFGHGGHLHQPVPVLDVRSAWIESGPRVDLSRTAAWGVWQLAVLIAAPPDFGGWITSGGAVVPLGSVADAVEWVFRRLLANQSPTLG